jgi:Fe-S-cluster containining protein
MTDFDIGRAEQAAPDLVPGRACGSCTLCCKVFRIIEVDSPPGQWCRHCVPGKGCSIYETRPDPCRGFFCMWMSQPGLGPEWKPEKSKIVLRVEPGGQSIAAHVDPSVQGAWQRSPYYEDLKRWSAEAVQNERQVCIWIGRRAIVILPDRDVDLGIVGTDEVVVSTVRMTAGKPVHGAEKIKRSELAERQEKWKAARQRFEIQKGDAVRGS